MPDDDATLSEFVPDDGAGDETTGGRDGDEAATAERRDADGGGREVDPAVSTADHRPGGAPCDACGATVRRRWRDDGALVCRDCKEW